MIGNYSYLPVIWAPLTTLLLLLALSGYGWNQRREPGALLFTIGSLLVVPWAAATVLEQMAVDAADKIFWFQFSALWQLPAATVITCFVLEYAWPGRWLTRRNLALLSVAPLLNIVLILTNHLHHLEWRSISYHGWVVSEAGPLGAFAISYGLGLGILNLIVFLWLFMRSPEQRWPIAIMLTGQITARAAYVMNTAHSFQLALPLDMIGVGFLFLMYAIALFRFRIFNPIPLARQTAIEQLHAGLLVLDPQGRVASLNPAAESILKITASAAKGRPVKEIIPAFSDEHLNSPNGPEIELHLGERDYTLSNSVLKDWRKLEVGYLLLLRDVTLQKRAQAQIVEQQRALAMLHEREQLARELHDSLGQVFAFVNAQGQTVRILLSRGDIQTADTYVARLVDVAREADVDIRESILGLRVTLSEQGLFPALERYLAQYEKNYGIQTRLTKPETMEGGIFEPLVEVQLLRILQEALTNVRKHAQANCVQIHFTGEDDFVEISVRDDGQGFDPGEFSDGWSQHIGLRVMRERAEEVGGSLSIQSTPGQGSEVVIQVPARGSLVKGARHG